MRPYKKWLQFFPLRGPFLDEIVVLFNPACRVELRFKNLWNWIQSPEKYVLLSTAFHCLKNCRNGIGNCSEIHLYRFYRYNKLCFYFHFVKSFGLLFSGLINLCARKRDGYSIKVSFFEISKSKCSFPYLNVIFRNCSKCFLHLSKLSPSIFPCAKKHLKKVGYFVYNFWFVRGNGLFVWNARKCVCFLLFLSDLKI